MSWVVFFYWFLIWKTYWSFLKVAWPHPAEKKEGLKIIKSQKATHLLECESIHMLFVINDKL